MNNLLNLADFNLTDSGASLQTMLINGLLLIVMNAVLGLIYVKTAQTFSNRKKFAAVFPLLSLTTMMIISVIKSSLALSLGMVGALSIVRFRSAIKEPEELTFIFLSISLGLGLGADQPEMTIAFFILVSLFLLGKHLLGGKFNLLKLKTDQSLYLNLTTTNTDLELKDVLKVLDKHCHYIELKRTDSKPSSQHFLFVIKVKDEQQLAQLKQEINKLAPSSSLSLLNDEKLFA